MLVLQQRGEWSDYIIYPGFGRSLETGGHKGGSGSELPVVVECPKVMEQHVAVEVGARQRVRVDVVLEMLVLALCVVVMR